MRIHTIEKDELRFYDHLLPKEMKGLIHIPGMMAFGAALEEDDGAVPMSIMLVSFSHADEIRIEWLYTDPEYRGQAAASQLLYLAFDLAQADKRSRVTARIAGTGSKDYHSDPIVHFLLERQFSFQKETENEWMISAEDAKKAVLHAFGSHTDPGAFLPLSEVSNRILRNVMNFALGAGEAEFPVLLDRIDKELSCVCVIDDQVAGVLLFMRYENTIYPVAFRAKDNDRGTLMLLMVSAAIAAEEILTGRELMDIRIHTRAGKLLAEKAFKRFPCVPASILSAPANAPELDEKEYQEWLKLQEEIEEQEANRPKQLIYVSTEYLSGVDISEVSE